MPTVLPRDTKEKGGAPRELHRLFVRPDAGRGISLGSVAAAATAAAATRAATAAVAAATAGAAAAAAAVAAATTAVATTTATRRACVGEVDLTKVNTDGGCRSACQFERDTAAPTILATTHADAPAIKLLLVHRRNSCVGLLLRAESDETEAAAAPGLPERKG